MRIVYVGSVTPATLSAPTRRVIRRMRQAFISAVCAWDPAATLEAKVTLSVLQRQIQLPMPNSGARVVPGTACLVSVRLNDEHAVSLSLFAEDEWSVPNGLRDGISAAVDVSADAVSTVTAQRLIGNVCLSWASAQSLAVERWVTSPAPMPPQNFLGYATGGVVGE